MRVAIFTDTYIPQVNGVAKTLNRFTNYLKDHGHSYHVVAPEDYGLSSTEDVTRLKSVPFKIYPECKISFPNLSKMKKTLKEFNPDMHEAITEIPAPSDDWKGKVIDEIEKGYYLNDKIIRFAKVVVGK